jgi:outer membrane biosynthesis protein TonB
MMAAEHRRGGRMMGVRARMTRALSRLVLGTMVVLVAPAAAPAQVPTLTPTVTPTATPSPTATPAPSVTPTPTATPTPEPEKKTKRIRRVYRDYERDGIIRACDHTRKLLRKTLKTITPEFEDSYPDFRDAVRAAIKQWDKDRCQTKPTDEQGGATPTPTPAPTSTPAPPAPTPTPAPATPAPTPDSGALPGTGSDPTPGPTPEATVTPVPTATPTPVPPSTAAQQEARAVVSRPGDQRSLLVPAILLGLVALGAAGAGGSALLGGRSERFAAVGQAWREAAFRASGTWGDFTDWLRLGR